MNLYTQQRAENCLWGGLIGDALGGRYEFDTEDLLRKDLAKHPRLLPILGDGCWGLEPGQVTDDSEMTLALCSAILSEEKVSKEAIAAAYHRWYLSDPFDIGSATRNAVSKTNPEKMQEAARAYDAKVKHNFGEPNLSNGMLMRIAPLGIVCAGFLSHSDNTAEDELLEAKNYQRILDLVRKDTTLTHSSNEALAYAVAYVVLIAYAILDGSINRGVYFLEKFHDPKVGDWNTRMQNGLDPGARLAHDPTERIGDVRIAFQLAVRKAAMVGEGIMTFEEAVVSTVKLGGDTDTNAAIVGNLCGAVCHRQQDIPDNWISTVKNAVRDGRARSREHKPNLLIRQIPQTADKLLRIGAVIIRSIYVENT